MLYVFRTLVDDDIPLNAGCLEPLDIQVPDGSLLKPRYPAAVVAGNVETSNYVTDVLFGALGVQAASQGTVNSFTFGNDRHQYYETICGGSGAGPGYDGTDAVHTHMTNTRLTDPEVLEWRHPVRVEEFRRRTGSGGRGRQRGGDGVVRRIRFPEPMTAAILSSGCPPTPWTAAAPAPSGATGSSAPTAASSSSPAPTRSRWRRATSSSSRRRAAAASAHRRRSGRPMNGRGNDRPVPIVRSAHRSDSS